MLMSPRLPHRLAVARPALGQGLASLLAFLGVFCWASAASAQLVEYYHTDSVGNVRAITDEQKHVIERHDYLPFGEECTTGPCASNPGLGAGQARKFTGKERDTETGQDYFGARYYGSTLGRFTSVDPIYTWRENLVDPQRWNRYGYARNNPLKYTDPDGRAINLVAGAIGAGIGGVAGFVGSAWAQNVRGGPFVWQDAWAASAGGAVSGGLAGLTLGTSLVAEAGLTGIVVVSAGTNAVGGAVTRSLDSSKQTRVVDPKEIAIDLGVGAAGGVVGAKVQGLASSSVPHLEATEAGMREAARRGGAGAFGASHGADGVARAAGTARTTAEVVGTVAGAKTTNVVAPVAREKINQE
jgi:RHS repeat-associated protein